jgi:hypothetical protein
MKTRSIGTLSVSGAGLGRNNFGFVPGLPTSPIYRFLGEPGFARDLQMGKVRISTLSRCRTIEDAGRQDAGEGSKVHNTRRVLGNGDDPALQGLLRRHGILDVTFNIQAEVRVEHAFVLCFTERNDSFARARFGKCGVEFSEPGRLFSELTKAICARGYRVVLATASRVHYRERVFHGDDLSPPLTELLKPPAPYADEKEVRFVWRLVSDPRIEWLDLTLPEPPPGCRVLEE